MQIQHYLATFVAQKTQELNVIQDTLQVRSHQLVFHCSWPALLI